MLKTKNNETLHKRIAKPEDLPAIDALMMSEHFNVGLHNLQLFYEQSPDTWCVIVDEADRVVAFDTYNRLPLNDIHFGYSIFVKPEYRGLGLTRLFDTMHYSKHPNMGNASGDTLLRFKIDKYGEKMRAFYGDCGRPNLIRPNTKADFILAPITMENFDLVADYDKSVLGFDRRRFMTEWILPVKYPCQSFGVVAHTQDNRPCGYGSLRRNTDYFQSTLYADNDEVAEWLFYSLFKQLAPSDNVFVQFPAKNRLAMTIVNRLKLCPLNSVMREYFGKFPAPLPWDMSKCYSLHEYFPL